jgi:hypothetical protein
MTRLASPRPPWLAAAASFVLLATLGAAAPAQAVEVQVGSLTNVSPPGTRAFCDTSRCYVAKGHALRVQVGGVGVAQATHVVDNSGSITPTLTGWKQLGKVEVNIVAAEGGSRGEKTVTLQYRVDSNVITSWPFRVFVMDNGKVDTANFPSPSAFFTEAEIVLQGSQLGNPRFVVPYDAPQPRPTLTRVSTSTDSTLRVRAMWTALQSNPGVKFHVCDDADGAFGCNAPWATVQGTVTGPPAMKSISCVPNPARPGDDLEITFELTGPARSAGEAVWWKVSSPGDFSALQGQCTYNNQGSNNTFTVPRGNTLHRCKVKVAQASGAGSGSVSRTIDSWVVNPNTTQAPWYHAGTCNLRGR